MSKTRKQPKLRVNGTKPKADASKRSTSPAKTPATTMPPQVNRDAVQRPATGSAIVAPQQDSYHPGQEQRLPNCMCSDGHGGIVLGKNRGKDHSRLPRRPGESTVASKHLTDITRRRSESDPFC